MVPNNVFFGGNKMIDHVGKACCGCAACANICPKKCIEMASDKEGFLYPKVNVESCVKCGLCERVCPVLNTPIIQEDLRRAWGAVSEDRELLIGSSSGGVFSTLAAEVIRDGGCVFGAAFEQSFRRVKHIMIETGDELVALRGSKYVQSEIEDTYVQVREQLKNGRKVLFSGTPCEIAGLKNFLGHDDEHLVTADLICHGTPSPLLWQAYLRHIEEDLGGIARKVNFRNKTNGWSKFGMNILTEGGKTYYRSLREDPFLQMFLKNQCLRESCYSCKVKESGTVSDVTLGDFWGVEKEFPQMFNDMGVSLLLVHTTKGMELWERVKTHMKTEETDYERSLSSNSAFTLSVKRPPERDHFFPDLQNKNWGYMENKYLRDKLYDKIKRKISASIIGKLKRRIIK